ncbi:DNA-deoxyinosine glycosylase [Sphingomonas tabacisoli]|uniref:DNA-deoxyinosine glycosylase n=1 Tax=Sphingomonas tabacisoli TaxID=2249466 RepID=A0ABW4I7F0_9SPHN
MTRHASFPPVIDSHTEILVLGSLPGVASLAAGRYYAHPRNQFWRLLGAAIGIDLQGRAYPARLAALREHRIGLWDVIADAERTGSLDAAIRNPAANDLTTLVTSLPTLRTIGFNGGTSARIGAAQLGPLADRFRLVRLPSSSPAHAVPFDTKLAVWRTLFQH